MKNNKEGVQLLFANTATLQKFPAQAVKLYAEAWGAFAHDGLEIISVYGGIGNALFDSWFATYSEIKAEAERCMNDDEIKCVVLCINSPGGMAQGLFEACASISALAEKKPCYAFIDGEGCSAAYALATACNRIYISEGSDTGCCGCYAAAYEFSEEAYKEAGILRKIFRSKNAPKKNLSVITDKEASAHFQDMIDDNGDKYLALCASNRGIDKATAETTFGQGEVVSAEYALENGMVDEIAGLDKCVSDLMASLEDEPETEPIIPIEENNTTATNLDSSQTSEGEGEDMTLLEKFNSASAEEQKAFLEALSPSLFAERDEATRKAEKDRLHGLEALRNGSEAVDEIVNAAVEDGRSASDIALDVVQAMKNAPKNETPATKGAQEVLETLADSDQSIATPSTASDDMGAWEAVIARANKSRRD